MPSSTERQAHLFAAVSHGWQPPNRHIDVKVAKEFHSADKAKGKWEHKSHSTHSQNADKQNGY